MLKYKFKVRQTKCCGLFEMYYFVRINLYHHGYSRTPKMTVEYLKKSLLKYKGKKILAVFIISSRDFSENNERGARDKDFLAICKRVGFKKEGESWINENTGNILQTYTYYQPYTKEEKEKEKEERDFW